MPLTSDCALLTTGMGMFVHLLFNRLEPRKTRYYLALLIALPGVLITYLSSRFSSVLVTVICVYPLFLAALVCSVVLYRISPLHPLANFPGPISNRISMLKMAKVASEGRRHEYMRELHENYGSVVRFGPNHISILDADAIHPILGTQGLPRGELHTMFIMGEANISIEPDSKKHAEMRKWWNRGFTPTALQGYDHFLSKRIDQLIGYLDKHEGKVLDLAYWINLFQFDFMGDLVFGGGFELMKAGGDGDGYWAVSHEGTVAASFLIHIPWVSPFFRHIPLGERTARFVEFGKDCVRQRLGVGCNTKDLMYYLSGEDQSERPPLERLLLDGSSAMQAATETTSAIIAGLLYFLLCYPKAYKRLQAEVDVHMAEEDGYEKLAELPYLNACLNETLRLMPANPSLLQRTSPKGRGGTLVCDNIVIPEETHVLLPPYPLQRHPRYFNPHPTDFWPERWLIAAGETEPGAIGILDFVHVKHAFIPFGLGPSVCVGKPLAKREARIVVVEMLRTFEMRFADGYDPKRYLEELRDDILWTKGELPVTLKRRVV